MQKEKRGFPLWRTGLLALALGAVVGTFLLSPPATVVHAPAHPAEPPVAQAPVVEPPRVEPPFDPATVESDPAPPLRPTQSMGHMAGLHRTPDPLKLTASAAVVIDRATGEVLARKNDTAVLPIASLTKLMTALVLMDTKVAMDESILITEEDVDSERNSRSRLRVGSTLTRAEALHLALMSSENRAAHALARTHPMGLAAFVSAMNAKAKAIGMKDTTFVDSTGLSTGNQSTARAVALLTAEAAKNPQLRAYSTTPQYLAEFGGRRILYRNSNRLIKDPDWAIALQKTGYIVEAGQCLAMQTRVAGQDLIVVILDAGSKASRSGDAERLRRFALAQIAPDHPQLVAKKAEPRKATKQVAKRKSAKEDKVAKRTTKKREQVASRKSSSKS